MDNKSYIEEIKEILTSSGADAWEITDTREKGWEFYFIRHALDQNRVRLVEHVRVKVYKELGDKEFLGSSSGEIPAGASRDEIASFVDGLLKNASYVKNAYYRLNQPEAGEKEENAPAPDVRAISRDFISAIREVPETESEDINSCELFITDVTTRFLNSEGIDVTNRYPSSMAEVVVNARKEGAEIELYRNYTSGECDAAALKDNLKRTMQTGRDKLMAAQTPNFGKMDVIFSTDAAVAIYQYFEDQMNASFKVHGFSRCEIGKSVLGEGDVPLTMTAVRTLPNSSKNTAYDPEGAPIRDTVLIEDGVAKNFLGSRQFSQYLGLAHSFIPGNIRVSGGTFSEEEIRSGRYLEIVEFSDFQVDAMSGDIAGEIRLAYYHDGSQVSIYSGGSVTGNMSEAGAHMRMSLEKRQYDTYEIPALTRLANLTIAGTQ